MIKNGLSNPYIYYANNIYNCYKNQTAAFIKYAQWSRASLYTINSYNQKGAEYQKTYFNGKFPDSTNNDTKVETFNPVNRLGGVTLKAKGGDNIFYGFDPELWKHLLPDTSKFTTTYNQGADNAKGFKRAADHEWHTVEMLGGRGNNIFNLGNVLDNTTGNGKFYQGEASYKISLTHDRFYKSDQVYQSGTAFGNATDPLTGTQLTSIVNLSLQADPLTIKVVMQEAQEGSSSTGAAEWSAVNGGLNAINKFIGNSDKINKDSMKAQENEYKKNNPGGDKKFPDFASKSKPFGMLVRAVPYADTILAVSSAVCSIFSLFHSKPAAPAKEEISATYLYQNLDQMCIRDRA